MKKGKFDNNKRGVGSKSVVLVLALALLVGCGVGGTLAWLTDKTEDVVNTFTVGDVSITLKESPITVADDGAVTYDNPQEDVQNSYPLIPGNTYKKDPVVEVVNTSEDCYLFVKFVETDEADTYLTYTSLLDESNGWQHDDLPENVWYREVKKADTDKSFPLLKDNTITINATTVTKGTMAEAAKQSLTYTAYAVQSANLTVAQAWEQAAAMENSGSDSTT